MIHEMCGSGSLETFGHSLWSTNRVHMRPVLAIEQSSPIANPKTSIQIVLVVTNVYARRAAGSPPSTNLEPFR